MFVYKLQNNIDIKLQTANNKYDINLGNIKHHLIPSV